MISIASCTHVPVLKHLRCMYGKTLIPSIDWCHSTQVYITDHCISNPNNYCVLLSSHGATSHARESLAYEDAEFPVSTSRIMQYLSRYAFDCLQSSLFWIHRGVDWSKPFRLEASPIVMNILWVQMRQVTGKPRSLDSFNWRFGGGTLASVSCCEYMLRACEKVWNQFREYFVIVSQMRNAF